MDIFSKPWEQYDSFNKAQLKIVDYVLAHPDRCGFLSLRLFAAEAGTTTATVLNFARKLGFEGFSEMRAAIQASISKCMMPIHLDAAVDEYSDNAFEMTVQSEQESVRATFDAINPRQYETAVELITEAECIYTFAYDFSPVLAEFFTSRFKRLGVRVVDLSHLPLTDALHSLSDLRKTDLLVLFSFPVYSKIIVSLAEYFHNAGYRVLCFSDSQASPAALASTVALTSSTNHIFFFNSMTPTISTINVLASMFLSKNKTVFDGHREKFEALQNYLCENEVLSLELMDPAFRSKSPKKTVF